MQMRCTVDVHQLHAYAPDLQALSARRLLSSDFKMHKTKFTQGSQKKNTSRLDSMIHQRDNEEDSHQQTEKVFTHINRLFVQIQLPIERRSSRRCHPALESYRNSHRIFIWALGFRAKSLGMPTISRGKLADTQNDVEVYARDSGVSFDEQDDHAYEQARRSRSHLRGLASPPPNTPPPLPPQHSPQSPPPDRSYSELLVAFQRQKQVIAKLRAANEEHAINEERLRSDLLAMSHRYLEARVQVEALEKRCKDAEMRVEGLSSQLENQNVRGSGPASFGRRSDDDHSPRTWQDVRDQARQASKNRRDDYADTATVSAGTVDSSEYVAVELSPRPVTRPEISLEEVLGLVRAINMQSLELARSCISCTTFRPGVRTIQADNKMVVDLTNAIGCILVQTLRSRDHSKNKATIELGFRALLSYHVSKLIEDWPFQNQDENINPEDAEDDSEDPSTSEKKKYSGSAERVLRDIATVLTLSGSPGQPSSLIRSHRERIGSTLDALFKTAERLACRIKEGRFDGPLPAEYSFLYARPGATFNKDLMQRNSTQQSMAIWKSASKRPVQVLCTREVGLARLHRAPADTGPLSRESSRSSTNNTQVARTKEMEVLSKVVVVFESDLDK
ncbi:uncharacterized protein FOMMEDRAFT_155545 [Fomitiporia mediterranea MF3/22]|uniref:uncharacterized protein n=1 Tax=Fomitiporia mediterranea (strain MF3/22) TaxID=694068 RepID=UPI0004409899|nr:uncharacterized protein FOMMEDRAFT_155545 [Fomitiporia mediterranea MF3/22]EJD04416.1 hypothetical protein FOMMEDRAFT_155545 [Fomitiporia mediterranea MF3/22]